MAYEINSNSMLSLVTGRKIVLTGKMEFTTSDEAGNFYRRHVTRNQVKDFVESLGGIVQASVRNDTNLIICGDNPGKIKITKGREKSVQKITFQDLLETVADKYGEFIFTPIQQVYKSNRQVTSNIPKIKKKEFLEDCFRIWRE